jgi:hypothetical protein
MRTVAAMAAIPEAKRRAVRSPFQLRDQAFDLAHEIIVVAGIEMRIADEAVIRIAREGRCRLDRRHHGAGCRIHAAPAVGKERCRMEGGFRCLGHGVSSGSKEGARGPAQMVLRRTRNVIRLALTGCRDLGKREVPSLAEHATRAKKAVLERRIIRFS